jgi:hypothetical protein
MARQCPDRFAGISVVCTAQQQYVGVSVDGE